MCYSLWYNAPTMWVHYTTSCNTQSNALEDGQNNCPKHVELTGIINKPLLLHLVGCIYYLYQWCTVKRMSSLPGCMKLGVSFEISRTEGLKKNAENIYFLVKLFLRLYRERSDLCYWTLVRFNWSSCIPVAIILSLQTKLFYLQLYGAYWLFFSAALW